ncbi:MAG: hypothetical protein GC188_09090 [Alphaproteobacteria bacterium]|nr:hypothetical protein [Alphaproteobacteria bacterium]
MTNETSTGREPKKTVSIEVRVSEEDKRAFWEACRAADRPASAVLRHLMALFVAFRNLRHRIYAMINRFSRHPLTASLAAMAMVATLAMSLLLTPSAAADIRLTYQVVVDDGVGQIVSEGQAIFGLNADDRVVIDDSLGNTVQYSFDVRNCDAQAETSCPDGDAMAVFNVQESRDGQVVIETVRGIVLSQSGETRYETVLSDGRTLSVLLLPQT